MTTTDVPYPYASRYVGKADTATQATRLGRCYELAADAQLTWAIAGWEVLLVHGEIGLAKLPHAWLEWRGPDGKTYVWDGVLDEVMLWSYARDDLRYRRWVTYTPRDSAEKHISLGHFGPWGKWDARYDDQVAAIEAERARLCSPDCDPDNRTHSGHVDGCGYFAKYLEPMKRSARGTTPPLTALDVAHAGTEGSRV